jgi:hypothetical protein
VADQLVTNQSDWEILRFVVSWAPYGGPHDEETVPRFGMNSERLKARFAEIVRALDSGNAPLDFDQRQLLRRACELAASATRQGHPRQDRRTV